MQTDDILEPPGVVVGLRGTSPPIHVKYITSLTTINSKEQNPSWEANSNSDSQEIPDVLRNPKVHYRVHKSLPPVPTLSHTHPIHIFPSSFLKAILISTSLLRLDLPSGLFPSGFPIKISYVFLICPMRATSPVPSHTPRTDHPNNIWWRVQVMKLLIMQSSPAFCHFLPLRSLSFLLIRASKS